jgi:ferredoxin
MLTVKKADALTVELQDADAVLPPGQLASGDYHLRGIESGESGHKPVARRQESGDRSREEGTPEEGERKLIVGNTSSLITLRPDQPFESPPEPGSIVEIQVRLQRPQVDLKLCIGCGVCEHECPVSGKKAIRVTAENESRNKTHSLLL